ncbi:MAG TPA: IS1 family transposase [Solirubrobacterales bacterium]|jgi:IS1 family transposase|nr:IS1 family transposase [Solirubrobacterales bacterium]
MNRLSTEQRARIIGALVEGNSIRATCRMTGAAKNTVTKLIVDIGQAAADYQDAHFQMLPCEVVEADEIWSYCYSKQKNVPEQFKGTPGYGDVWTFTAICADTKLIPSWLVGERTSDDAEVFLKDLASRMAGRIQLSTDGHRAYEGTVAQAFGQDVDWAQIQKHYSADPSQGGKYSPPICVGTKRIPLKGDPDPDRISTSYVERQNLTMRMGMRRFTRLTNGFSKKVENLAHAVSLHFLYYNFARPHASLKDPYPRTPAMAAGVADHVWTLEEIAGLLD